MDKDNQGIVVKSNEIIQKSRFELTLLEMKIVDHLIASIKSPKYDKEFNIIEFSIYDFLHKLGQEKVGKSNYENLKKVLKNLRDKSVYIELPDGRETTVSWIEKPIFNKRSGIVQIKLDDDMKPYLLNLSKNFSARYEKYTLKLESGFSHRLYELLFSFKNIPSKQKIYPLEELRVRLNATKKSYENYGTFKQRILVSSVKEINEKTDMNVSYKEIKKGRKVDSIIFFIKMKEGSLSPYSSTEKEEEGVKILEDNWQETEKDEVLLARPKFVNICREIQEKVFVYNFGIYEVIELVSETEPLMEGWKYEIEDMNAFRGENKNIEDQLFEKLSSYLFAKYAYTKRQIKDIKKAVPYMKKVIQSEANILKVNNNNPKKEIVCWYDNLEENEEEVEVDENELKTLMEELAKETS